MQEYVKNFIVWVFLMTVGFTAHSQTNSVRKTIAFNSDWKFVKDSLINAEQYSFDDTKWRSVDLPHDWSIEDLPNQTPDQVAGPFSKKSIGRASTGWTVGGTGWYRKTFTIEKQDGQKQVSILFDGVYMDADVWINGQHIGNHPNGYTPFHFNLTPYLKPTGQKNVIAVRVRNEGKNSRWYSGSGIYRHVLLSIADPIHVATWGVHITTPEVTQGQAKVQFKTTLNNTAASKSNIRVSTSIVNGQGKEVASAAKEMTLKGEAVQEDEQTIALPKPVLWSLENPYLYTAITTIQVNGKTVDQVENTFGVRTLEFDGAKGFLLNGKRIILKGGCLHHDNGPLGAAAYNRAEERKIEIMKRNGFNAVRSSHNPPSKAMLDACDRLGMLMIDEAFDMWVRPKNPDDYAMHFNQWWKKDLQSILLRDRNHPSIIMWSIGNEIYEAPDLLGKELAKKLIDEVHSLDKTRPVTEAFVYTPPYTQQPLESYQPHAALLDVEGYNYFLEDNQPHFQRDSLTTKFFDRQHAKYPKKTYVATESLPLYALENWNKSIEAPYVLGSFKWTAFDYMGEAGIGYSRLKDASRPDLKGLIGMGTFFKDEWPIYNSYCGDFDLIGNKKVASYYQDVVWGTSPIEMFVKGPSPEGMKEAVATWGFPNELKSWTWTGLESQPMQVHVYTRSKLVKLLLNGKQVGEQKVEDGSITATFQVNYQPGTLVAEGYDNGKKVSSTVLTTTGKAKELRLKTDAQSATTTSDDLVYVNVEVVDEKGNVILQDNTSEIAFEVGGKAKIAAVGNGSPNDMSSFQQNHKKVYQGRGMLIVQPTEKEGKIKVKATAPGLKSAELTISPNDLASRK